MIAEDLPYYQREALQNSLLPGEKVEWIGRPHPSLSDERYYLVYRDLWFPALVMSFLLYGAYQSGELLLTIILVPVTLLGMLAFFAAPWWYNRQQRRSMYVLTGHRALVLRRRLGGYRVLAYKRHADMIQNLTRHKNGTVSLELGADMELRLGGMPKPEGFLHLPAEAWEKPYTLMKQAL